MSNSPPTFFEMSSVLFFVHNEHILPIETDSLLYYILSRELNEEFQWYAPARGNEIIAYFSHIFLSILEILFMHFFLLNNFSEYSESP